MTMLDSACPGPLETGREAVAFSKLWIVSRKDRGPLGKAEKVCEGCKLVAEGS